VDTNLKARPYWKERHRLFKKIRKKESISIEKRFILSRPIIMNIPQNNFRSISCHKLMSIIRLTFSRKRWSLLIQELKCLIEDLALIVARHPNKCSKGQGSLRLVIRSKWNNRFGSNHRINYQKANLNPNIRCTSTRSLTMWDSLNQCKCIKIINYLLNFRQL